MNLRDFICKYGKQQKSVDICAINIRIELDSFHIPSFATGDCSPDKISIFINDVQIFGGNYDPEILLNDFLHKITGY